jgi:hypothetical protein
MTRTELTALLAAIIAGPALVETLANPFASQDAKRADTLPYIEAAEVIIQLAAESARRHGEGP